MRATVFVCAGNTCRSAMADAILRDRIPGPVRSAGVSAFPGAPAMAQAVAVAKEYGGDLSQHRATPLSAVPLWRVRAFVAMTPTIGEGVKRMVRTAPRWLRIIWGLTGTTPTIHTLHVPDPYGADLDTYRDAAKSILAQMGVIAYPRVRPTGPGDRHVLGVLGGSQSWTCPGCGIMLFGPMRDIMNHRAGCKGASRGV